MSGAAFFSRLKIFAIFFFFFAMEMKMILSFIWNGKVGSLHEVPQNF
jgi:hypothetical protein